MTNPDPPAKPVGAKFRPTDLISAGRRFRAETGDRLFPGATPGVL